MRPGRSRRNRNAADGQPPRFRPADWAEGHGRAMRRIILFFFNDTATTEIYTLPLHDALPILIGLLAALTAVATRRIEARYPPIGPRVEVGRSEEHTSALQSRENLVCRLL